MRPESDGPGFLRVLRLNKEASNFPIFFQLQSGSKYGAIRLERISPDELQLSSRIPIHQTNSKHRNFTVEPFPSFDEVIKEEP